MEEIRVTIYFNYFQNGGYPVTTHYNYGVCFADLSLAGMRTSQMSMNWR